MLPAISQICTLNSSFEADVADYAAAKCLQVEVWLTKLEAHLKQDDFASVKRLREEHGVSFPAASLQGGLFVEDEEKLKLAMELFQSRLQLCAELEIPVIVVALDIAAPLTQSTLDGLVSRLTQIATEAGKAGVDVALEFQSRSAFGNNLQTAAALVADVGSPHLGLCLDTFHFFVGPSKMSDLDENALKSLFHVQISDAADVVRELSADSDRILPGDGDFPLDTLIKRLRDGGYERAVSVELMNPQIWKIPPLQVAEVAMTSLRKQLGLV